jgi:uncharacterized protein involved in cysteine biosynthesis
VRGSILAELGWLLFFIVLLVVLVYVLNVLLVPHHFNPTVANAIAAIFAGLGYIVTRVSLRRRGKS